MLLATAGPASATPHALSFSFGSNGSGAGQISQPSAVAVNDATGNIYVADQGNYRVDEFDASGNFVRAWGWGVADGASHFEICTTTCQAGLNGSGVGEFNSADSIAVDNSAGPSAGDVYVGDSGDALITKFDPSGNVITSWGDGGGATCGAPNGQLSGACATGGPFTGLAGITTDTSGDLFAYSKNSQELFEFGQDGTPDPTVSVGGSTAGPGIGVDSNGNFYKVVGSGFFTGNVAQFTASGSEVGTINNDNAATGFVIDPTTNDVYISDGGDQIAHYSGSELASCVSSSSCTPTDTFGSGDFLGNGAGALAFDPATNTVYVADISNRRIDVFTQPLPQIDSVAVENLSASSADLTARINPNGTDTTYHIEWGTSTSYGNTVPVPDVDLGSGDSDVTVSQHITGLSANTTYHWRVVLTHSGGVFPPGTIDGQDHTFIYETAGSPGLPDGRAYEQVTPVDKNAATVELGFVDPVPLSISDDGSRVIYTSVQCFLGAGSCTSVRGPLGEPYMSTRTATGWTTQALAPPAQMGANTSYNNYDANQGTALFSIATPPGGEDDWYVRRSDGSFVDIGPVSPPSDGATGPQNAPRQLATPDLSHLVWENDPVNTGTGQWPFDATTAGIGNTVYEYVGTGNSQPLLVGVSGGQGSTDLVSKCGTMISDFQGVTQDGLSADGNTVIFTARSCASGSGANSSTPVPANEVWARIDNGSADAHSVLISARSGSDCGAASGCASSPPGDAEFEGMSADGSKVVFASTQQLTDNASEDSNPGDSANGNQGCTSTTGTNGCNLYLYDFNNPAGQQLIDVSAGDTSGHGPRVQGVVQVSPDGSHVYFVAQGVLTSSPNVEGQTASDGAENLYVYERDAAFPSGHVAFIGDLSAANVGGAGSDSELWQKAIANVSPDGRFLVFPSDAALTADTPSGTGAAQVYRYDAQTGELLRLSLSAGGFNDNGNSGVGDATIVPAHYSLTRSDPTMSDDGSYVFFQSPVALTPNALNDVPLDSSGDYAENLYEWHNGQVSLISDGRDVSATNTVPCGYERVTNGAVSSVCLLGTNPSGSDVFFTSDDPLVPQDTDSGQLNIWDARIGGGFPYTPAVGCSGDTCQGNPGTAPSVPVAATVSFVGPGNPSPAAARRPPARVRVVKRAVKGSSFIVTVVVPGRGRITITGAGVRTLHRSVARAGSYRLRVVLTAGEERLLKRRHGLKLRLQVAYAPAGGSVQHVSFSIIDHR